MFKRSWFLAITLFWVTMNVLLWRSEMSLSKDAGSPLPAETVWERILTAPDESAMEIYQKGRKVGYVRWAAPQLEALDGFPAQAEPDPTAPEGLVQRITGYELALEGSWTLEEPPQRLRFSWQARLDSRQAWRTMQFRLTLRPNTIEVLADAAQETVTLRLGENPPQWQQTFKFKDLAQPQLILAAFGLPLSFGPLADLATSAGGRGSARLSLGLNWQAWTDTLRLGTARMRVYRLKTRLFDQYEATALISRVGEILRLELPHDLLLVNESLPRLPEHTE